MIAAGCALAGRMDEAQRAMSSMRSLDPTLRLGTLGEWLDFHRPGDAALLADGLRRAGMPE